jgi:hypothetical protein
MNLLLQVGITFLVIAVILIPVITAFVPRKNKDAFHITGGLLILAGILCVGLGIIQFIWF